MRFISQIKSMCGFLDSILIPLTNNVYKMRLSRTKHQDIEEETEPFSPECKSHRLNRTRKVTATGMSFDIKSPIMLNQLDDSDPWSLYK